MVAAEKFIVGRQLLDVITSGMYDNPLMVYREYVQNAVDSIDSFAVENGHAANNCEIHIEIDGKNRSVAIEDTGAGLPEKSAEKILLSLGFSPKEDGGFRGFRGIGRLGGLGYCDRLRFETRSSENDRVTEVIWNRSRLDELAARKERVSLEEALTEIVETKVTEAKECDPERFFRVTLENVRRFHSDQLMQVSKVRSYLAQVAPVPFSQDFKLGAEIERHLNGLPGYKSYSLSVNGERVFRCYEDTIEFSDKRIDRIEEIQTIKVTDSNNQLIAKGWVAKLKYYGSLPSQNNMRGIRIRQGNIEVGGEYCLAEHFSESRFATWQVGEIHIAMNAITANARRDGFENSPNYERLLEYCTKLGKHLSKECRQESKNRNNLVKAENSIDRIRENLNHNSIFIDSEHFRIAKKRFSEELLAIKRDVERYGLPNEIMVDAEDLEMLINSNKLKVNFLDQMINFRRFNNKNGKKAFVEFVKGLVKNKGKSKEVDQVLLKTMSAYFNEKVTEDNELVFSNVGI